MKKKFLSVVLATAMVLPTCVVPVIADTADRVEIDGGFSANTGDETLVGDFDVTYTFNNATQDHSQNWFNFIVEVIDGAGNGVTLRADGYGWSFGTWTFGGNAWTADDGSLHPTFTGVPSDWSAWNADMADCDVAVNIVRTGNNIDVTYDFVAASGATYQFATAMEFTNDLADSLKVHLTGEKVNLSDVDYKVNEMTIDAGFSENSGNEKVVGDFEVEYEFNNATQDNAQNWFNFIVEVTDGVGNGITLRADGYGWTFGTWALGGNAWTADDGSLHPTFTGVPSDWSAWNADMADCDVTVGIVRDDSKISVVYDFVASTGNTYQFVTDMEFTNELADTLYTHVTGEKVKISDVEYTDKSDSASVSADVPATYAQYKAEDDGEYTVRIVSEVAIDEAYQMLGYRCDDQTGTGEEYLGTDVYQSIKANGKTVSAEEGNCFVVFEITDVDADAEFFVTPVAKTATGTTDLGSEITVNMATVLE